MCGVNKNCCVQLLLRVALELQYSHHTGAVYAECVCWFGEVLFLNCDVYIYGQ